MSSVKEVNTKYHRYYYPDDKTNIKDLDLEKILAYERPYKKYFIHCVAYKRTHGKKNPCV